MMTVTFLLKADRILHPDHSLLPLEVFPTSPSQILIQQNVSTGNQSFFLSVFLS